MGIKYHGISAKNLTLCTAAPSSQKNISELGFFLGAEGGGVRGGLTQSKS